jgi:predicted amidohydrolase
MKIGVAQTQPSQGDIAANIAQHKKLIGRALAHATDLIVFPELSLTGYEPELASELAIDPGDNRLDSFQEISDANNIIIGVGIPTKGESLPRISTIFFQPHKVRQTHSKRYLHLDEVAFFSSGESAPHIVVGKNNIALAICYELSVPQHAEDACKNGANIYVVSAAKNARGVEQAREQLGEIAQRYAMTVLLSNSVGPAGGFECAGLTSIWNDEGNLLSQLDNCEEGVLVIDTETQTIDAEIV